MQTREAETKNDLKELMYAGLFTRLYNRGDVRGKQRARPTDVHTDSLAKVCFRLQQKVAHLDPAANETPPARWARRVSVSCSISLSTAVKQSTVIASASLGAGGIYIPCVPCVVLH